MRVSRRSESSKEYWRNRWLNVAVDSGTASQQVYPLKYAVAAAEKYGLQKILEVGCGAGRVLRYFHDQGKDILGIDYIDEVIQKIKATYPELKAEPGDVTRLRFDSNAFDGIFAFGVFHSLEKDYAQAVQECFRVIKPGGVLVASVRANNVQTRLSDFLHFVKHPSIGGEFHKWNFSRREFQKVLEEAGFEIRNVELAQNMPFLYKFKPFRYKTHKVFDESLGRKEGYRLSPLGDAIQKSLIGRFPEEFCNLYVFFAQKPQGKT